MSIREVNQCFIHTILDFVILNHLLLLIYIFFAQQNLRVMYNFVMNADDSIQLSTFFLMNNMFVPACHRFIFKSRCHAVARQMLRLSLRILLNN
jgi:hypothetical protein